MEVAHAASRESSIAKAHEERSARQIVFFAEPGDMPAELLPLFWGKSRHVLDVALKDADKVVASSLVRTHVFGN